MPFHNIGDVVWRACDGLGHWCVSRTAPGKPALVVTTWLESRQSLTADFSQAHQAIAPRPCSSPPGSFWVRALTWFLPLVLGTLISCDVEEGV